MAYPWKVSEEIVLKATLKGLKLAGYQVDQNKQRIVTITKDGKAQKVAIRTTRFRRLGCPKTGSAWRRKDIDTMVIGAVNSVENPTSVEVRIMPRTEVLKLVEAHRAYDLKTGKGYAAGPGPAFIRLDQKGEHPGWGLAEDVKPIAVVDIADVLREEASGATEQARADVEVDTSPIQVTAADGTEQLDRFKQDVADSARRWLRVNPLRIKVDISITIEA